MIKAPIIRASELIPGDILVYNGSSWLSFAIQFFTRSKYNHVSIKGTDGLIWEAIERGYVPQTLRKSIDGKVKQVIVKRLRKGIDISTLNVCIKIMSRAKYEFSGTLFFEPLEIATGKWEGDKEVIKDTFCSKANGYIMAMHKVEPYTNMWYKAQPGDFAEDCLNFDTYILDLKSIKKL